MYSINRDSPNDKTDIDDHHEQLTEKMPICRNNRRLSIEKRTRYHFRTILVFLCLYSFLIKFFLRLKSIDLITNAQNVTCDNQEKSLLPGYVTAENYTMHSLSRIHSSDLVSNIQMLIDNKLVKFIDHSL